VQVSADNYYRNNLQNYSDEYRKQIKEFREANLLFAIMEKNVWGKANVDTSGQVKYYNQHKAKYRWEASADALIVTCANEAIANEIQRKLPDSIKGWRTIIGAYDSQVTVDSGRFELGQLPVFERTNFTPALITLPVKNPSDGTTTFNYIINVYSAPDVKSFEQARGLVISDYQQVLEEKWLAELKKKYPVKVDMAVFNSIR
jgi:peptidyl-prolyl cis-trans isomerase SurA